MIPPRIARILGATLLGGAVLAGCAGQGAWPARPDQVSLHGTALSVHFTDGARCGADLAVAMQGDLVGCPTETAYQVVQHRAIWVPGAEAVLEPYATITLVRHSDGRRFTFRTPKGGDPDPDPNYGQPGGDALR
ncbi:hypothetical protein CKO11_07355 [Rhodobacter sp. TJ_12]|uniref:hypothetical protein n=1 Tax=Rhodobacter sp. TJ_12 TaxID=2029399 RepID=UPI001CBD54CC|nr:hypothetical protein [Rhodobacter sp. TJ_12]MBZ4022272.1 hypothetical protein [Rhodobacter sp. TJ_12]